MNIKVSKSDFLQVLTTAIKAVPTKTSLPILENFLLSIEDGVLSVTASDANITVIARCKADGEGKACVPAKTIRDIVSTLPDGEVSILSGKEIATISWSKGHSTIPVFLVSDYPEINAPKGEGFSITTDTLKKALKHTLPHTSSDEIRPQLCGVCFNPTDSGLDIVASDAHTMCVYPIEGGGKPSDSFLLPSGAASLVRDIPAESVTITSDESIIRFESDNIAIQAKKIIGKFPNYSSIIPNGNPNVFTFPVAMLMDSIRRVSICSNKSTNFIKLSLNPLEGIIIESQDTSYGCAAREEIDFGSYDGDEMVIGLRADLVLKTLAGLDADKATMRLSDSRRAVLVVGDGDPSKSIVMPIQIS